MSGVSLPVTRPIGRALIIGGSENRTAPLATLQRLGFQCAEVDDPYHGMAELCRRPLAYRAIILSLNGIYREELGLVSSIKRRFGHIEIWLTQTDGRQGALAEAMRLGADGLLSDDGLHRIGVPAADSSSLPADLPVDAQAPVESHITGSLDTAGHDDAIGEPVLTADELRALLQEQPAAPPGEEM
jgi:hypothetical protein